MPAIARHHRHSLTSQRMPRVGDFYFRWKPVGVVLQCVIDFKHGLGLDHFEGRSFTGWHRHVTLAALAQAFCTMIRTDPKVPAPG
jgi:hypothetical protein